uniref:Cytochrome c oxidase subunit 3 n=1 Tax=Nomada fabriciana TaxID=601510 RepID=A0A0S2LTI3_9HYME|nr:cytochrome c oxidase subunit III [Nomada fabriciana]
MMISNHPFHLVTLSPWPLFMSLSLFNFLLSTIMWMYMMNYLLMIYNFLIMILCMIQWWRDVIRESTFQGMHTFMVMKFLKFSMILFIISELFFFISFFWTYFHMSISPDFEIGQLWPPKMINYFNPYDIPLLNSIILISSGLTVTWSHHSLLNKNYKNTLISLFLTIILGIYFSMLQMFEYLESSFCLNDSVYGSIFFMSTGFHGLHIIIGTSMLLIVFIRLMKNHFSSIHNFNFESSLWYWHFVDVIWLFLYIFIYWWMY